jgi:septin family protein
MKESLERPKKRGQHASPPRTANNADSAFTYDYLETEIDHERIGVTLWDSPGLEKHVVDIQLREISAFLESKFEETFAEEQRVIRAPGVLDTHIHCVFLVLDPLRLDSNIKTAKQFAKTAAGKIAMANNTLSGLDEDLDLQVLRTLQGKTTVIPVISKADTVTQAHMNFLKRTVWASLKAAKLDPLEALELSDSEEEVFDEREEDEALNSSSDKEEEKEDGEDDAEKADEKDEEAKEEKDKEGVEGGSVKAESEKADQEEDPERSTTPDISGKPPSAKSPAKSSRSGSVRRSGTHRRQASAMSAAIQEADPEIPYLPMSTISPDEYEPEVVGRRFPWGLADPYNIEHCDFVRLKESVFSEWRSELREAAREQWYEGWRTSRLNQRAHAPPRTSSVQKSMLHAKSNGSAGHRSASGGAAHSKAGGGGDRAHRQVNTYH